MATANNDWCRTLGIEVPRLEAVRDHSEAIPYSLLLVALLESGEAMTLDEVAQRFEQAGITDQASALFSLKRCRPDRAPVYRVGDQYHLDPHSDDLDLWVFRLGLREARVPALRVVKSPSEPIPSANTSLKIEELDEAWKNASLQSGWSAQRLVLAVLDAHQRPMQPSEVVAFVAARTKWHRLDEASAKFKHRGSPIAVLDDGRWAVSSSAGDTMASARSMVRERLQAARSYAATRPDPAVMEASRKAAERQRDARRAQLAKLKRALLTAYPAKRPQVVALVDIGEHSVQIFMGDEFSGLHERLADFDYIGAVDVRALLRALDFDPGERRLAEMGPAQKTKKLNRAGRTLKITTALLVQGSCGISRPFGDESKLAQYLATGALSKLRARIESDAKSLYALYEYGRLHGCLRLRWGFLDEFLEAPWVHRDERGLYELMQTALQSNCLLEVVVGNSPGWSDPWSRAQLARVVRGESQWRCTLVDEAGCVIDESEVQRARVARMQA